VTALGKLVRSTAFRLTLVYLLIFALYAAALLIYFAPAKHTYSQVRIAMVY